jgi:hypothetical protein
MKKKRKIGWRARLRPKSRSRKFACGRKPPITIGPSKCGMKVKVRIRFRGREITYPEIAREDLAQIAKELEDIAVVEQQPDMEGRTMLMVLGPARKK